MRFVPTENLDEPLSVQFYGRKSLASFDAAGLEGDAQRACASKLLKSAHRTLCEFADLCKGSWARLGEIGGSGFPLQPFVRHCTVSASPVRPERNAAWMRRI